MKNRLQDRSTTRLMTPLTGDLLEGFSIYIIGKRYRIEFIKGFRVNDDYHSTIHSNNKKTIYIGKD